MNKKFLNSLFFNIDDFKYKELLDDRCPWESIADLSDFIQKLFSTKMLIPNYKNKQDIYVGKGTTIHPTVEITGPAIIGNNCEIRHAAYLRENCILGDNVIIGHAAEIKNSIILNSGVVNHFCYAGDSIIGNSANISAGAKLANLRLDRKNINIKTKGGKIDTGLSKFGSAIGDNSMIGVNSVINPGTLLGKNTIVFPLKSISGVHSSESVLK